ncbi:MAG: energy-coupling factor ABC transporter substrate-binding protein [Desulfuromonadales bacterium]|nr:energy-coupling factor ABC transporter substrate-binding protein [Desulfuromonadales bacterium]
MSGTLKNSLLLAAVVLLTAIPLLTIKAPGGGQTAIFTGTDNQAQDVIQQINPDYQPWFESLFTPASGEIESLLFALQAALGAGVIGYYVGYVRGKRAQKAGADGVNRAH